MKKFLITLIILIIAGSVVFFFGWVQFSVPPGKYGVVNSKTHGLSPDLVKSGQFRWIWYKLIPTNVKITVFSIEYTRHPINYESRLPSGNTYTSFVGITNADFSWNLRGDIVFNIKPESLVSLSSQHNLENQEDLDSYLQKVAADIELALLKVLSSADTDSVRLEHIMAGSGDAQIEQMIRTRYPEIDDFSLIIHSAKFPDFVLYRQLKLMYDEYLSRQREVITSTFSRRAENHIENQLRFEELERYGDLLTRFPVLLDYLTMENSLFRD